MNKKTTPGISAETIAQGIEKVKADLEVKPAIKQKADPKLFVSGRFDRNKSSGTTRSMFLLKSLEDEIKAHCRGGDVVVLNYLIKEGLKAVKSAEKLISVDCSEIMNDTL